MTKLSSRQLLELYQRGESDAATAIFDRYAKRLLALAQTRVSSKLSRRLDAEDLVQSAYRSFFAHAKDGEYQLQNEGDLWRLLASITLNKLYGQAEKNSAAKRSLSREEEPICASEHVQPPEPSPAEVVALFESLQVALRNLNPDELHVLNETLEGRDASTIAGLVQKSERTVRRLLASAREKIEQRVLPTDVRPERTVTLEADHITPLRYGDYVLLNLLNSGGMGKVYRARSKCDHNKIVALKTLHKARHSDVRAVTQFIKEANILSQLSHPNIVRVEGLGQFPGGGYFMVMDFIEGNDLQGYLELHSVSLQEALAMALTICDAVGHAHQNGIVHGDLKPGNILRRSDGKLLVTDFGFAYLTATRSKSGTQFIGGTTGYIAPEILKGTSVPSASTDIYSLGMLLSALVTGKPIDRSQSDDCFKEGPATIALIVDRCIASAPKRRYQSIGELTQEISDLLN